MTKKKEESKHFSDGLDLFIQKRSRKIAFQRQILFIYPEQTSTESSREMEGEEENV